LPIEDDVLLFGKLAASLTSGILSEAIVVGLILGSAKFLFPKAFPDAPYPDFTILTIVFLMAPPFVLASALLVTVASAHVRRPTFS